MPAKGLQAVPAPYPTLVSPGYVNCLVIVQSDLCLLFQNSVFSGTFGSQRRYKSKAKQFVCEQGSSSSFPNTSKPVSFPLAMKGIPLI